MTPVSPLPLPGARPVSPAECPAVTVAVACVQLRADLQVLGSGESITPELISQAQDQIQSAGRKLFVLKVGLQNTLRGSALTYRNAREREVQA